MYSKTASYLLLLYLALSGTIQGVMTARARGAAVTTLSQRQSATHSAIHGRLQDARVKKMAMLMLATNVRHFGPTYSSTVTYRRD